MEQMGIFKHKEQKVKDRQSVPLGKSHENLILGEASADQNEKPGLSS